MRKITLLCVSLGFLASLQAKDNVFVGIEAGMSYNKYSHTVLGNERTTRTSSTYQNARIGKYFDAHRVAFNMQSSDVGFSYDYMIDLEDQDLTPYIGTGLSYYRFSHDDGSEDTSSSFSVPVSIGFTYPLSDRFELDAGLRYSKSFLSSSSDNNNALVLSTRESSYGYHIGFNYSF